MRFSERWLRTFADPGSSTTELAQSLTMAGLEVEEVVPAAPMFAGVMVGLVLDIERHPNAERLNVCKVDVGTGRPLNVVCGAPNVARGVRAPCAIVGAQLPGLEIKEAILRGVASQGMLCSAAELGISDDASGLFLLASDAPVGEDLRTYLDLDDQIFGLKLTSNRGDCLSLLGIAREVAAITGAKLKLPDVHPTKAVLKDCLPVTLAASKACPRYTARIVRDVDVSMSTPAAIVRRLERSGVRSISAIVDLTNYVMLELGQPLHAFDLDKLTGGIEVRYARVGESLELLNGQTLRLDPDLLVICDASGPVALAGIMGGAATGVSDTTTGIFLESAFFEPKVISGKWRTLGFTSDASHRFERGVDYEGTVRAIERLTRLIIEICGGKAGPVSDVVARLPTRNEVRVRVPRAQRILGMPVAAERVEEILERLEMRPRKDGDAFVTIPPSYRFDVSVEEDLIEEIVRIDGYNKLPATLPTAVASMLPYPERMQDMSRIRQVLVARDYQEAVTYSFVDESWERDFAGNTDPIRLANPIAAHMSVMRSSLLGSLVDCLRFNVNRRQSRVRIFEISRVFARNGKTYDQRRRIGVLAYGFADPEQWGTPKRWVDFYDVRSDLESLFALREMKLKPAEHPALHPGKSARVLVDGTVVGWIGELHPRVHQLYDLPGAAVAFEIDAEAVAARALPTYREFPKFPPVQRDIAVEVPEGVPVEDILGGLREGKSAIVDSISIFDVYRGTGIGDDKKGLAFRVLLQDTQKTLTDAEIDAAVAGLLEILEKEYRAKLR